MKPQPLGTINPCGRAVLLDQRGRRVCSTLDTPNAVQVAFEDYPRATKVVGSMHTGTRRKFTGRCLCENQRAACRKYTVPA